MKTEATQAEILQQVAVAANTASAEMAAAQLASIQRFYFTPDQNISR